MTVSSTTTPSKQYNGNDSTTQFAITFEYLLESEVIVTHTDSGGTVTTWTQDAAGDDGYTISSGNVVANTAPETGSTLRIYRDTAKTQLQDYKLNRQYNPELIEDGLDRLTLISHELEDLDYSATEAAKDDAETARDAAAASAAAAALSAAASGQYYYVVDPAEADQGVTATGSGDTIYDILQAVGTSKYVTIVLPHTGAATTTTFTFDTSLDMTTYPYAFLRIEPGAQLARTTGDEVFTVYSPENIIASNRQKITDVDMLAFAISGTVYPHWWGAFADGSSHATAGIEADRVALQRAIDAMYDVGGGTVLMAQGTYLIDMQADPDRLTIKEKVGLTGENITTTIKCTGTPNIVGQPYYIWLTGEYAEACNFTLDGNADNLTWQTIGAVANWGGISVGADTPVKPAPYAKVHHLIIKNVKIGPQSPTYEQQGLGITLFNGPRTEVHHITFIECNSGIYMSRDFPATETEYRVSNILGFNMTHGTIHHEFGDRDVVTNVVAYADPSYTPAHGSSPKLGEAGIFFHTMYNLQLSNVTCYGGKVWNRLSDGGGLINCNLSNIKVDAVPGATDGNGVDLSNLDNTSLSNINVTNCAKNGVYIDTSTAHLSNVYVGENDQHGFQIANAGSVYLSNCVSELNGYHGYTSTTKLSLSNCTALNNSQASGGTYDGLRINANGSSVTGGSYIDTQGTPTQNYGIYKQNTGTCTFVGISDISGNVTGDFYSAGGNNTWKSFEATYADNAAAVSGGLSVGDVYKTATGEKRIVV